MASEALKLFEALESNLTAAHAEKFAAAVRSVHVEDLSAAGLWDAMESAAQAGKKKENKRQAACMAFGALAKDEASHVEAYTTKLFPIIMQLIGDKTKPVAKAAEAAVKLYAKRVATTSAETQGTIQEMLECLQSLKFQVKIAALECIAVFASSPAARKAIALSMPDLVPAVGGVLHDTKAEVREEAEHTLMSIARVVSNKDIETLIPMLVKALMEPENVPDCIYQLSCTKFVATVQRPELALITPLLVRGFRERDVKIVRQSSKIADNLSKLVEVASEAEPLLPMLIPAHEEAAAHVADPECRNVCTKVLHQLNRMKAVIDKEKLGRVDEAKMLSLLSADKGVGAKDKQMVAHAARLCESLFMMKELDVQEWTKAVEAVSKKGEAEAVAKRVFKVCEAAMRGDEEKEEENAEELCNCTFTLAYGNKILLKNTNLRLVRGVKYGLIGPNECGKTSLLKAIANDQVEGFPPSTEVRTTFVEADILGELSHLSCIDYIFEDPRIKSANLSKDAVMKAMEAVGFAGHGDPGGKAARIMDSVSSLSGGWRMKLALARAMLQKADILLMDDPTNHLDVKNVAWVEDYIKNLKDVTCMIVSSNPSLLSSCCSRLVHIENLRLHSFKGTLKDFVEERPEAKSYFELTSTRGLKFSFPEPGFIEGVTSRGKVLMKMDNVDFSYPGNPKPTVVNLTVRVSMASRVACLGPNGAGKSTMIKLLTGELEPEKGTTWKHPNAKIAYVAQHAFHHIEKHLKMTPTQYILWRYEYGTDKEALNKVTMVLTPEEEKKLTEVKTWEYTDSDGLKRQKHTIEKLTGVRKNQKKGYLYEVQFSGKNPGEGPKGFVAEEKLIEGGWGKHVKMTAERILAEEGRYKRPLTQANVEKLLTDVGLETEYASHYQMSSLSGGQKVKVVLAAAMWDQPHIVILDEPTNYLDRESLAALAGAIQEFKGGVVIITHNDQFSKTLCPETWILEKGDDGIGRLDCKGDADWMEAIMKEKTSATVMDEMVDALGNVSKVKAVKKELSRKEKKQRELAKKRAKEMGQDWSSSEED
ncbi:mRNA export factor elf1 [Diplonema papillatum]|nr:mRNA export factor elf1 [Diplonema papillatum]